MKDFVSFVETMDIGLDQKKSLADPAVLKNHSLYLNLVRYLSPVFTNVEKNKAEKLSLSGYLYFRFLLSLDHYIDELKDNTQGTSSLQKLLVAFEFYEKSIRGLSSLFDENDKFWNDFASLKQEYYQAVVFEKKISTKKSPITEEVFIKLAAGKSSICDAFIYALSSMSGTDQHNAKLLECFRRIHVSLQYIDDIDDFKKDIEKGQWTYAQYLVQSYLEEKQLVITDPAKLNKYLFLSGIATYSVEKAIENLDYSIWIADELNLIDLGNFLNIKKGQVKSYLQEINLVLQKTKVKSSKSNELQVRQSILDAVETGIIYLDENVESDNTWSDFLTSAGFGKAWITGYIGFQLAEINSCRNLLETVLEKLVSEKSSSFNDTIVEDGDSLNFKIGFWKRVQNKVPHHELKEWLKFMNEDGGWVTYRDEKSLISRLELEDVGLHGWLTSKFCVSAAAAYVLSHFDELQAEYKLTCKYLIENQQSEGQWPSYWWTSSVYATSFGVMALSASQEFKKHAENAAKWLAENQHPDGYWKNGMVTGASAFYSALALKALLLFDPLRYEANIRKGVEWLIQNQTTDGSWLSSRILRIPATNINDPSTVANWRLSSLGVNCLVDDHNRVFTTATVVNALASYDKIFRSDIDIQIQYKADAEKPHERVSNKQTIQTQ